VTQLWRWEARITARGWLGGKVWLWLWELVRWLYVNPDVASLGRAWAVIMGEIEAEGQPRLR
jgi:hypothetical protein